LTIVDIKGDLSPFFYAHYSQEFSPDPAARGTGDITHNIEGIDEEFREFCPAGAGRPVADFFISRITIGLGVVGSFVRQEPNNSVYLAPFGSVHPFVDPNLMLELW